MLPNLQVAKKNGSTLPSAGLFIIRYHSFYRKHGFHPPNFPINLKDGQQPEIFNNRNVFFLSVHLAALHKAGAYKFLMKEEDKENLKWLQTFK